jgi:glycerol-3-phosphate acyltransferase PlsY
LDTEIIKLLTPFFSLHLAGCPPNLLDNPTYFFCLFVSIVKILLLNIKQIFKSNLAIVVFFEAFPAVHYIFPVTTAIRIGFNIIDKHTQNLKKICNNNERKVLGKKSSSDTKL